MSEEIQTAKDVDADQMMRSLIGSGKSSTGVEEMMNKAAEHTLQVTATQARLLLVIKDTARKLKHLDEKYGVDTGASDRLNGYERDWKAYHKNAPSSQNFIMKIVGYASLGEFVLKQAIQLGVQKK